MTRASGAPVESGNPGTRLRFKAVLPGNHPDVVVPPNYAVDALLRWGYPLLPGAVICGPEFSGDKKTFFCAIEHPHEGRVFGRRWPTDGTVVPKSGVIAVRERSGKKTQY